MIIVKGKLDLEDRMVFIKLADIYFSLMDVVNAPLMVNLPKDSNQAISDRVNSQSRCVQNHFKLLGKMNREFDDVTDFSVWSSRDNIKYAIDEICLRLQQYAELVAKNKELWKSASFLSFPGFGSGRVHYAEPDTKYPSNPFNPSKSYSSLVEEARELSSEALNFTFRTKKIPVVLFNEDHRCEPDDKTLSGRILAAREQIARLKIPLDI